MGSSDGKRKKNITMAEVESFLGHTESCIKKIDRAVSVLPKVEKNGSSECPFAKELYQKKQEAQDKVASCMKTLAEHQGWVKDQIGKCKDNLVVVSANADRLNNDLPQQQFTDAEVKLAATYKKLVRLKVKVEKTIKKCQKAIQRASKKNYPDDTEKDDVQDEDMETGTEEEEMDEFLRAMLGKTPKE